MRIQHFEICILKLITILISQKLIKQLNLNFIISLLSWRTVDPGDPVVIIPATGSEVRGFKPCRGRWILSERKNAEYDFLRIGSEAVGSVS